MNKIKHFAFALSGALLVTAGLISCDNDKVSKNEEASTTELKAKGDDMAYQDFYLGQDGDEHRYDSGLPNTDCTNEDGTCAPQDIVIDVDRKKPKYLQLIAEPLNYQQIFIENRDVLAEDIHPTLVDGVINGFFKLETMPASDANTTKFQFKRVNDNVLVGTYQFIID